MGRTGERHISRMAVPKSWPLGRHVRKWATRPRPGMHPIESGMPLNTVMKDMLGYAKTTKEARFILNSKEGVLVDGKRRNDRKFIIGLMDILSFPKTKENFRVLLNKRGKVSLLQIDDSEAHIKLCRIKNKIPLKGKFQLNLHDGRNILVEDKGYSVGSTVVMEVPSQKIREMLPFEKGAAVYMASGKHVGSVGVLQEIKGKVAIVKTSECVFETPADYTFVVGKEKPIIKLEKET